jgi:hypothetical protein
MANTQGMASSFKSEILKGEHNLGSHTIKAALFLASATVNASTTAYSSSGEVSGSNYTAGGVTVTAGNAPSTSGTTGIFTPSASIVYTNVTLSTAFDAVLLYNSTASDKAISVHTFGSQTVTAGTFTLTMPTNDASNALIRIA